MLNFYWDINKIKEDLNKIDAELSITKENNMNLFLDKLSLLGILSKLSNESEINYEKYYYSNKNEKNRKRFDCSFEQEIQKILNIIINNRHLLNNLFLNISKIRFKEFDKPIKISNILNEKSLKYISQFLQSYDQNLLNHFDYLYTNNYININDDDIGEYNGYCIIIDSIKKQYININSYNPLPVICHETAHAYESQINKSLKSWNYGINIYNEVFAIVITLLSNNFLLNTEYHNNSIVDQMEFLETVHILSKEIKRELNHNMENFVLNDFTYAYDANIALALSEQYLIDKKEGKRNIDYFINNCDVNFSNKLLKSVDIDLKKLYSGGYYLDYYKKVKKLTR